MGEQERDLEDAYFESMESDFDSDGEGKEKREKRRRRRKRRERKEREER
jgi:hypothetical protein